MKRKAKIIFFGTPNFAIPTLKSLINSKYSVLAVVTTPDKPQGRGNKINSLLYTSYWDIHSIHSKRLIHFFNI